jgi:hypothetical protein
MPLDAASLYMQLSRLLATMPDLNVHQLTEAEHQWLGKLDALLTAGGDLVNLATLRAKVDFLGFTPATRAKTVQEITIILHRALAAAELNAPVDVAGAFIPAGNAFDAMAAVGKVLTIAKQSALIVDAYMDEKTLTDFAPLANEGVAIQLLADEQRHKVTLRSAQTRWGTQWGARRPLEIRLASAGTLHDRLIVVDGAQAWVLTQSLNAFAVRSPATIARVDPETSALKIPAYAEIWAAGKPLQ